MVRTTVSLLTIDLEKCRNKSTFALLRCRFFVRAFLRSPHVHIFSQGFGLEVSLYLLLMGFNAFLKLSGDWGTELDLKLLQNLHVFCDANIWLEFENNKPLPLKTRRNYCIYIHIYIHVYRCRSLYKDSSQPEPLIYGLLVVLRYTAFTKSIWIALTSPENIYLLHLS